MDGKRVLIVEPDSAFGLSLAAVYRAEGCATAVAGSAAEGEREMTSRAPDLVVVRAELPDLSGFSLCGRLRRDRPGLPVILFSSESTPEALAEHARTPAAANAYLAMPLDTAALAQVSREILAAAPVDLPSEALVEEAPAVELRPGQPAPPQAGGAMPPPVPRRQRHQGLTDEDRIFLTRAFQSIAERRADLVAESFRRRPPPRRDLLATPEGRVTLLREELKAREAQVARLAQIWEAREEELSHVDDRLHEKEVELQELKLQVDEGLRRLDRARDEFLRVEREHGASIEGMLLEKFSQEKELIEVVAGKERRINELERGLRLRDDDLARRKVALDGAVEEAARLERQGKRDTAQVGDLEAQLAAQQAEREAEREAARAATAALQARIDEREQAIREREDRLGQLEAEARRQREAGRIREEDLGREVADHLAHLATLESDAESAATETADREAELRSRLETLQAARAQDAQRHQAVVQDAARRIEVLQRELARRSGPASAPGGPRPASQPRPAGTEPGEK